MFRRVLLLVVLSCALATPAEAAKDKGPLVHTVYEGQTLQMIARRYRVSVDAICKATDITPSSKLKPGQKLMIPAPDDKEGAEARKLAAQGKFKDKGFPPESAASSTARNDAKQAETTKAKSKAPASDASWRKYLKPARRKGFVTLHATGRNWSGYAIIKGNRVSSRAQAAFKRVLYSWRTGEERDIDPRLVRLLTEVSDKFGGRPLKVASGYRENSFARESKHKLGRACDFSIEGVPNDALYAYLSTLEGVGVGYYPNSSFVHLDVRPKTTHWTDFSEPGEAPRKSPRGSRSNHAGADAGASE